MKTLVKTLLGIIAFIAAWHMVVVLFAVPTYIIPTPLEVASAFVERGDEILKNTGITAAEVLLGFLIANIVSCILAMSLSFFPKVESVVLSMAVVLKTMPIIAIAPILVLWFGPGLWSKVAAVIVICFFPSLVNILRGIKSLDTSIKDLVSIYSPTRLQTVRLFFIPGIKPYIYSSLKISSSMAVVGALVGEFISANSGLGFMIISGYYNMDIPLVFAILVVVSSIGLILYGLINLIEKYDLKH